MYSKTHEISTGKMKPVSLAYLFFQMLKIGAVSWGGFMALISVVQRQFAGKDRLIDNEEVLDGIALASVLPGPVAFNVVTFIGYRLRGLKGAFLAMTGILFPSFVLMVILSCLYFAYGDIPAISSFFKGIYPAIAAIILAVAIDMGRKSIRDVYQVIIALSALTALVLLKSFFITLMVMVAGGLLGYLIYRNKTERTAPPAGTDDSRKKDHMYRLIALLVIVAALLLLLIPLLCPAAFRDSCYLQRKITMIFSGLSLTLFGGGYVVIPVLQNVFVQQMHWLSLKEFADAIALGQITPGPIFISATFIGYKVGGLAGAVNATISIFLPPALLMIVLSRFLDRVKHSVTVKAIFKGLRPAVIGMILSAVYTIARGAEASWISGALFVLTLFLVIYYKVNVIYLIPLAGVAGIILFRG